MTATAAETSPLRVLIADDHDLFAASLAEALRACPWIEVVGRASDGSEAFRLAGSLDPDVVLMDVDMPVQDGILATRQITDTLTSVKVVVVSALSDAKTAARARAAGAGAYVFKGCPFDDLLAAIREVAASARLDAFAAA